MAVRPRIVQKVLQNVLHTFFFGSFSSTLLCRKNRLDFFSFKYMRMKWKTMCKEIKVNCFISRTKTDICTILLGSFENTLAFNSSYIHYSTLRCRYRYIDIYRYTVLVSCTNLTRDTLNRHQWQIGLNKHISDLLDFGLEGLRGSVEVALCLTVNYCENSQTFSLRVKPKSVACYESNAVQYQDFICWCYITDLFFNLFMSRFPFVE